MSRGAVDAGTATLPRHNRGQRLFRDVFGVPAREVLAAMDAAGDDVASTAPEWRVALDSVGLRRRDVVLSVDDPFGSGQPATAVCTVCVSARVPPSQRGLHLSRVGHAVAEHAAHPYTDPSRYAEALARAVAHVQHGSATVTVYARVPYLEQVDADRSGRSKLSLEHLHVISRCAVDGGSVTRDAGIRVTHVVACPCVQKTLEHARRLGADTPETAASLSVPPMTHSQRCVTSVTMCGVTETRPVPEMLAALDRVLVRTCNTLPRDAELAVVREAHATPQFIEDALRSAVLATARSWPARTYRCVRGRSTSQESIHEYDITASLTLSPAEVEAATRA